MTVKTLGHCQLTGQLGKGGMGEVYQAKDKKLGRDVAIKVLPEEFAMDADRVARFQREAKLLASLNHPNIIETAMTPYLNPKEIKALLKRRTLILDKLQSLIKEKGEEAVLFDIKP